MPKYNSRKIVAKNEKIRRVVETLIDGTVSDDGTGYFRSFITPCLMVLIGTLLIILSHRRFGKLCSGKVESQS